MMTRRDWLLLFLDLPGGPYEMDQLRAMKGMFLFNQEAQIAKSETYDFSAYSYGPFDSAVYRDLDGLEADGLLTKRPASGNRRIFALTQAGSDHAQQLSVGVAAGVLEQLTEIKRLVTSLSFTDLLRNVYSRYPDYAVRTVARV